MRGKVNKIMIADPIEIENRPINPLLFQGEGLGEVFKWLFFISIGMNLLTKKTKKNVLIYQHVQFSLEIII